jgi:hypothetical protein
MQTPPPRLSVSYTGDSQNSAITREALHEDLPDLDMEGVSELQYLKTLYVVPKCGIVSIFVGWRFRRTKN